MTVGTVSSVLSSSTAMVSMAIDSYANIGSEVQNPVCADYGYAGYADVREKILINGLKIGDSTYAGDIWDYQIHIKDGYITIYTDNAESIAQLSKDGAKIKIDEGFTVCDAANNYYLISAGMWKYNATSASWTKDDSVEVFGDLNGDGFLSALDVVSLRSLLLSDALCDGYNDINGDSVLDIRDLVRLKKKIAAQ